MMKLNEGYETPKVGDIMMVPEGSHSTYEWTSKWAIPYLKRTGEVTTHRGILTGETADKYLSHLGMKTGDSYEISQKTKMFSKKEEATGQSLTIVGVGLSARGFTETEVGDGSEHDLENMVAYLDGYPKDISLHIRFDDDETKAVQFFDYLHRLKRQDDGSISFNLLNPPIDGSMKPKRSIGEDEGVKDEVSNILQN